MLDAHLQERASLYACGAIEEEEGAQIELLTEFNPEVRQLVSEMQAALAAFTVPPKSAQSLGPDAALKARIMGGIAPIKQAVPKSFVVTDPDARVCWASPTFIDMCGHQLEELKGRRLGGILQGALTDPEAAAALREAVRLRRAHSTTLINYHKDGRPYWVSINMRPITGPDGEAQYLAATEEELYDKPIPEAA